MEHLFSEFKPASAADWKARLEKDLKGVSFSDLQVTDRNGITIHPFYTLEDWSAPSEPLFRQPEWDICSSFDVADPVAANKNALNALEGGASGLIFRVSSLPDFSQLLEGIGIQYISLHFELSTVIPGFTGALKDYVATQGLKLEDLNCSIAFDPLANMLSGETTNTDTARQAFLAFANEGTGATKIICDNTLLQNAGATSAYQLACVLAHAHEYLYWLHEAGMAGGTQKIRIAVATGTGFYEEIAKLRALRLLLPFVFEQYNSVPQLQLHVTTSGVYRSQFDAYSNLLRDTISGMAGVLGGCDSLLILPFDEQLAGDHKFGNRMSRNQQLLFKEESYLDKVADVGAGAYYIESLTQEIAAKAWEQFQAIEKEGGLIAAFSAGTITQEVQQQASEWIQAYKDGKRILIGVNKYPNATDKPVATHATTNTSSAKGLKTISLTDEMLNK